MAETWLYNNPPEAALLSLDEVVRVELAPQIISMLCSTQNLSSLVTHPKYRVGTRDAAGRWIGSPDLPVDTGVSMQVVDWKAFHVPKIWKVYRWQLSKPFENRPTSAMSWTEVNKFDALNDAIEFARFIRKEMSSDAIHY
ncbi:MAG: hypothetical protein OEM91_16170 [Hyphomicrobiales bacterium]|nr:hypothetical protein [Hyphomicrobiales bacterium]